MTAWSLIRLTVWLWLARKAVKVTGWLLAAAVAVAAWPVTVVAVTGYAAAWLRGWPPARLRRAAAWALPATAVWLGAQAALLRAWRPVALAPVSDWDHGWQQLSWIGAARTFVLVAPAAVPAGLGLGALAWAWRIYAITTGLSGIMASAPITFDTRQWKRQVRTAR